MVPAATFHASPYRPSSTSRELLQVGGIALLGLLFVALTAWLFSGL